MDADKKINIKTSDDKFITSFVRSKNLIKNLNLEIYYDILDIYGLEKTWKYIISSLRKHTLKEINQTFVKFDDIGELYEIGLAHTDKIEKKDMGKYYTPTDVASVMSKLLLENNDIENIADVACGTGNLIIEVIKQIQIEKLFDINQFIKEGHLYLYDLDPIALDICVAKIELIVGESVKKFINRKCGDFLSKTISLPENCSVITNPPYSLVTDIKKSWTKSDVMSQSKDLYAGFIDKILTYSNNAVIVSPQSFLVSDKFSILREKLGANFYGEIFSFDNVPGTLFNGRKHGIFNTNNANAVRASISSIKRNGHQGFRLSHLIRFRSEQRKDVIDLDFLRTKLGETVQDLETPLKAFRELEPFVDEILTDNRIYISDLIEENESKQLQKYKLNVSTSARYYTVASKRNLDRNGVYEIYAKDEDSFYLIYALLSSSYAYMWWRFHDGGILFSKRWLLRTPLKPELINEVPKIKKIVNKMIKEETDNLSYKKNAGAYQESIKFPLKYRNELNNALFSEYSDYFELLHRNNEVYPDEE